ncbi:hypothetical protein MASR1M74_02140 [Lentimicrobium sp.]
MSAREIREKIKAIAGEQASVVFTAEVVMVDGASCTVDYGGRRFTGVKLFSIGPEGKFIIKPAPGSMVTVADLSAGLRRDLCLLKIDKIEQLKIEHEGLVFDIDGKAGKFEISSKGVSLTGLLTSLADILKTLKVAVLAPNAPSSTITPDTLTLVNKFETDLNRLLK